MRKATKLELKSEEKEGLEQCFRSHPSAAVRSRCQLILLKAQGRTADDIAAIVNMCVISVHSWIRRYRLEGLNGLLTKAGRGRKKILRTEEDAPVITQTIKEHRQSLKAAKAAYEAQGGKQVSEETFRVFLKALAMPIKESENGWVKSRTKTYTTTK